MTKEEAIKILIDLSEPGKFEVVRIFETPRAGEEVDNGCGVDFELSRFAVFVEIQIESKDSSKRFKTMMEFYHNYMILKFIFVLV